MILIKNMNLVRGFLLLSAQLAGAIFSAYIVSILFPTQFNVRTTLSAETSLVQGVFIEALLTAELVFTIFMLANEKHRATFMAPVGIGLALFVSELIGVYYTGGVSIEPKPFRALLISLQSLNPARSFGPCVVSGVFDSEHWIYCKPSASLSALRTLGSLYHRGRTWSWGRLRRGLLQVHQDFAIRSCQPRPGRSLERSCNTSGFYDVEERSCVMLLTTGQSRWVVEGRHMGVWLGNVFRISYFIFYHVRSSVGIRSLNLKDKVHDAIRRVYPASWSRTILVELATI